MTKKLLLTSLIVLCLVSMANATCTPPTTLKCECQHPIINSEGKLACGEDYCAKNGKKCMPNGSCCEADKFCESSLGKQCCPDGQSCDTTKGCQETNSDIEKLCAKGSGSVIIANNGNKFCIKSSQMDWYEAQEWCLNNGMSMASMYDLCPSWIYDTYGECSEFKETGDVSVWTSTLNPIGDAFLIHLPNGEVRVDIQYPDWGDYSAICTF